MSTLEQLESDVQSLTPKEFSEFREWLTAYENKKWDEQMEGDALAGRLDFLSAEVDEAIKNGLLRPIDELCDDAAIPKAIRATPSSNPKNVVETV